MTFTILVSLFPNMDHTQFTKIKCDLVLKKKLKMSHCLQTTHDDGRKPSATGHRSDRGDLKKHNSFIKKCLLDAYIKCFYNRQGTDSMFSYIVN